MSESSAATSPEADLAGGIGRRLAAHRARRGIRVAELAREVGVTPSLISQIERGQSRPSVSTLFAFAQALDVPVDAFFREPGEAPPGPAARAASAVPEPGHAGASPGHVAAATVAAATAGGQAAATAGGQAGAPMARDVAAATEPGQAAAGQRAGAPGAADQVGATTEGYLAERRGQQPGPAGPRTGGRYLVRRSDRAVIDIAGGVSWERLTRSTLDHLDFFELIYEPGAQSHPLPYTHPGTEMVLVTSGRLEITVGFESYLLEPGDSMDFPSSMPHRYVNPGSQTARAVTVILYDCPGGPGPARRAGHAP